MQHMDPYIWGRNAAAAAALLHGALMPPPEQPLGQRLWLWGCFARILSLVYALSFWSLGRQLVALCGPRGVSPVDPQLVAIRRDYGLRRGFQLFPTLLWFTGGSDGVLRALPKLGAACAIAGAVLGGWSGRCASLLAHALLISLDFGVDLCYPWDCLLFEVGFLSLWLPVLPPLWEGASAAALPPRPLAWAFRWLLFRLMLGFGKLKFYEKRPEDSGYIKNFMLFQPMMTYVGWWAQKLPVRWHQLALVGMFVIEVLAPFALFCTGLPRAVAAAAVLALQVGIQLGGNFGHFNILSAVLCIPMFDVASSLTEVQPPARGTGDGFLDFLDGLYPLVCGGLAAVLLLGGMMCFAFNSWVSQGWLHWPAVHRACTLRP
jgi:hypothetical protein